MIDQGIYKRVGVIAYCRMSDHASWLIDNDDIVILIDDPELLPGLYLTDACHEFGRLLLSNVKGKFIACIEDCILLGTLAVQLHVFPDHAVDHRKGSLGIIFFKKAV